jgi:tRNA (guanosine-2'-O-)-methyltransferase
MSTRRRRNRDEDYQPAEKEAEGVPPDVWDLLVPFLGDARRERLLRVLDQRTDRLTLVLDSLYDPHNLSAILRTAEALGLQHVVLTGTAPDKLNPQVALGAQRWLSVRRERDARACCAGLKADGFTVAAAVLSDRAVEPSAFQPSGPVALVLGNEHEGLGAAWTEGADVLLRLRMRGFGQSLNVSVAAGILMALLLEKPSLAEGSLPETERRALADDWIRKSVPHSSRILARLRAGADDEKR